jgi:molybdenum cofactor cytidylyltransferase
LDRLIDESRRVTEAAVVPTYGGRRGNPVIVKRALFAEMLKISGDTGFRAILGTVPVAQVPVDDRGVIVDIDLREDLATQR